MGAVYEARHVGTGRRVAVKVILNTAQDRKDEALARFQREACPRCKYRPRVEESLFRRRPDLAKQWDVALNGALLMEHVTCGSRRRVWWRCTAVPDHVWQSEILDRVRGSGCPHCRRGK
jgi:hypothetical protein